MTEQSANSQDSGRYSWQQPPQHANTVSIGITEIRTTSKHVCPECGERVQSHMDSCPACGENLAQVPKPIRCMHCHTTASSELVVCPGCGRELREAPPKLVTLGVPTVLALLLVLLVVSQWERISPIAWARTNLVRGVVLVEGISASIEPEMVIMMTPIVPEVGVASSAGAASAVLAENVAVSELQSVAMATASVITPIPDPNVTPSGDASILAVAVAEESPIGIGGPQSTAEPTGDGAEVSIASSQVAAEALPTETLPTATAPATNTPPPTNTPQPPTATATAQPTTVEPAAPKAEGLAANLGSSEATRTPTPTWTAQAADASTERSVSLPTETPIPAAAGLVLAATPTVEPSTEAMGGMAQVAALAASDTALPTATATPTVVTTPLPTPTVTPVVYQIRAGDTLVTIAATYDVDVDELMAANNISGQEVFAIQPGQMLIIPVPIPVAEPVSSAESDPAALRLEAPALLVPTEDATVGCATGGKLIWQRVQFIKDSDKYVLHLGFINGEPSRGQENVMWVLAQNALVTQTEWELDTSLCELAPAEYGRQWRWWVEVVEEVDGRTVSVSPPSEVRSFVWQ